MICGLSSGPIDFWPARAYIPRLTFICDPWGKPLYKNLGGKASARTEHILLEEFLLANHTSAIKRHKQNLKKAARNRSARTRMKNAIKAVRAAVLENNAEKASAAFVKATSILDKTAGKGVIHWKNAARKISRLAKAVNTIEKA